LRKREPLLIQMEILASLIASPKVITRLAQSCNVNMSRVEVLTGPMLARGLVRRQMEDGQEVYFITDEGYKLYNDWIQIWRRLPIVT
jgi:predicted transcriptional regulator